MYTYIHTYILYRYFDCQRPDFADAANINGTVDPLYKIVIPCRRDGTYTYIHTYNY